LLSFLFLFSSMVDPYFFSSNFIQIIIITQHTITLLQTLHPSSTILIMFTISSTTQLLMTLATLFYFNRSQFQFHQPPLHIYFSLNWLQFQFHFKRVFVFVFSSFP
jgi:hypothetical protein